VHWQLRTRLPRPASVRASLGAARLLPSRAQVLNLSELPAHVAEALRSLDADGDGHINLSELHIGAQEASHSVRKVRARAAARRTASVLCCVC
jgi:hypothetical protein